MDDRIHNRALNFERTDGIFYMSQHLKVFGDAPGRVGTASNTQWRHLPPQLEACPSPRFPSSFLVFLPSLNRWKGVRGSKGMVINWDGRGQGEAWWEWSRFSFPSPFYVAILCSMQRQNTKIPGCWSYFRNLAADPPRKGGMISTDSTQ